MAQTHSCPACDGGRKHIDGGCHMCNDTGRVAETPAEEAASASQGYDPREITGL